MSFSKVIADWCLAPGLLDRSVDKSNLSKSSREMLVDRRFDRRVSEKANANSFENGKKSSAFNWAELITHMVARVTELRSGLYSGNLR